MPVPAYLSNHAGNLALSTLLAHGGWLAAHTSDPGVSPSTLTEVAGGGYERQPIKFSTPNGKSVLSVTKTTHPGMPAVIVTHLAVWNSPSLGDMIFALELTDADGHPTPITVAESAALITEAGDVGLTLV